MTSDLTRAEVAVLLHCSISTVKRIEKQLDKYPLTDTPGRGHTVRYTRASVLAYRDRQLQTVDPLRGLSHAERAAYINAKYATEL